MASSSAASVSPSPSVTGEHSTSPSWSVRSPVWSFFEYDTATEKSICQVELSAHVICAHISGKYPATFEEESPWGAVLQVELSIKKAKNEVETRRCSISHKAAATTNMIAISVFLRKNIGKRVTVTTNNEKACCICRQQQCFQQNCWISRSSLRVVTKSQNSQQLVKKRKSSDWN